MHIQQVEVETVVINGEDGKKHRSKRFSPRSDVHAMSHGGVEYESLGNGVFEVPDELGHYLLGFDAFRQPTEDARERITIPSQASIQNTRKRNGKLDTVVPDTEEARLATKAKSKSDALVAKHGKTRKEAEAEAEVEVEDSNDEVEPESEEESDPK